RRALREHRDRHDHRAGCDRLSRPRRRCPHPSLGLHRHPGRRRAPALDRASLPSGDRDGARDLCHRRAPAHHRDRAGDPSGAALLVLALEPVLTPALSGVATVVGRRCGPAIAGIRLIPPPDILEQAPEAPRWDLPVRMFVATGLVILITSAAPLLGPKLSGLLTTYPVYAGVLAVFAHAQRGGAAAVQVVRG